MTMEIQTEMPRNGAARWLQRIDDWTLRWGDRLNPILVKEARQALKSKQFVFTFSLLLVAAWAWTVTAILLMMPRLYYVPSGSQLILGYYFVLAVPMILVVPIAAHRSLASEIDDGTLDLLSVTTLSPVQIITGKLASATLQMMLYFVALLPCVAFSYVLRGIDISTIVYLVSLTVACALLLTLLGLFLASLPRSRPGQLLMLVTLLVIVVIAEWVIGIIAIGIVNEPRFLSDANPTDFYALLASSLFFAASIGWILIRAATAELTPPSENRSTPVRIALLGHQTVLIACIAFITLQFGRNDEFLVAMLFYAGGYWLFVGALMVGETAILTPRVRRELPSSFVARMFLTWLTPGPTTGLACAVIAYVTFLFFLLGLQGYSTRALGTTLFASGPPRNLYPYALVLLGYLMFILTATRFFMWLVRLRSNTHPATALAVLIIVAIAMAGIPYSLAIYINNYRAVSWSYLQITNWAWNCGLLINGGYDANMPKAVFALGSLTWTISLLTAGRRVLPLRVATPKRVLEETQKVLPEPEEIDPLAD